MEDEEIESAEYTITWGELLRFMKASGATANTDIMFGNGNLEFYRIKHRGENLLQIQFNQNTWPLANDRDNAEWEKRVADYKRTLKARRSRTTGK